MPVNRSLPRNVRFYDASDPGVILGGLVQNGSITEENFLDTLAILLVLEQGPPRVQERSSGRVVHRTPLLLGPGEYDIYSDGIQYISSIDSD